jgi:hypothetical protein
LKKTIDASIVVTLVSVLGIPEYVSKGRIDAGVAVVVCRVVPKVRVGKRR